MDSERVREGNFTMAQNKSHSGNGHTTRVRLAASLIITSVPIYIRTSTSSAGVFFL